MSNERVLSPGVWAGATPGFHGGANDEALGYWFYLDAPGILTGFSQYTDGENPLFALYQLWTHGGPLKAQAVRNAGETYRAAPAGWRTTFLHPRVALLASTPYLLTVSTTRFGANFGVLTSAPWVSDHFTVYKTSDAPDGRNGVYSASTDAGGGWPFISPPDDAVGGHLYAIDMLVEF